MALYITRGGQQYGPYSMAEAQEHVRSGNLTLSDMAWQEGLPNWVPLSQIPGFVSAQPLPAVPDSKSNNLREPKPIQRQVNPSATGPKQSFFQNLWKWIVGGFIALAKFKFLLIGALKTGLSMLVMIWAYWLFFGWPFAVGLVAMIFVHELGHVAAALLLGLRVTSMMFVPFFGAYVAVEGGVNHVEIEAKYALGGPVAGCIGSTLCFWIGMHFNLPFFIAIASIGFVINIINMIPVPPLDGGSISAAISHWFWLVGLVILIGALFYFHSWVSSLTLLVILFFMTLPRLDAMFFGEPTPEMEAYYASHLSNRVMMAVLYLGVLSFLVIGYWAASNQLHTLMLTS